MERRSRTLELFRVFTGRTRLRILNLLRKCECCPEDVVRVLRIAPGVARDNLRHLEKLGLVRRRRTPTGRWYRLAPPESPLHSRLVESLGDCELEESALALDLMRAVAGGCGNCPPQADAAALPPQPHPQPAPPPMSPSPRARAGRSRPAVLATVCAVLIAVVAGVVLWRAPPLPAQSEAQAVRLATVPPDAEELRASEPYTGVGSYRAEWEFRTPMDRESYLAWRRGRLPDPSYHVVSANRRGVELARDMTDDTYRVRVQTVTEQGGCASRSSSSHSPTDPIATARIEELVNELRHRMFNNPSRKLTEEYITGRFGCGFGLPRRKGNRLSISGIESLLTLFPNQPGNLLPGRSFQN